MAIRSVNVIHLLGNVGKAPNVKSSANGKKYVTFSVATNHYAGKGNEPVTHWHNCIAWDALAEICEKYMDKGTKVHITGELTYFESTTPEGGKVKTAQIVARDLTLLGGNDRKAAPATGDASALLADDDDDLPF